MSRLQQRSRRQRGWVLPIEVKAASRFDDSDPEDCLPDIVDGCTGELRIGSENAAIGVAAILSVPRRFAGEDEAGVDDRGLTGRRHARRLVPGVGVQLVGSGLVLAQDELGVIGGWILPGLRRRLREERGVLPEVVAGLLDQPRIDLFQVSESAVTGKTLQ